MCVCVYVFNWGVTNYHKLSSLKQHAFICSSSVVQKSRWAPLGFLFRIPQSQNQDVSHPRPLSGDSGKNLFPRFLLLQNLISFIYRSLVLFPSLQDGGSGLLFASRASLKFFPHGPFISQLATLHQIPSCFQSLISSATSCRKLSTSFLLK